MNEVAPQLASWLHSSWQSVAVNGLASSSDSKSSDSKEMYQPWHVPPETMVGASSTVMPSAAEASAAEPRLEESDVTNAAGLAEAGTAMVAVMITLPGATLIVTSDLSKFKSVAMLCCKLEVSE